MRIACTMPVRNEDWILGLSARAVLMWADDLIIGLHACADESAQIAEAVQSEHPGRVTIVQHTDPVWTEMAHRQRLLEEARALGATHVAIVDADEVLTANLIPDVRGYFERTPPGSILQIPWLCLRGSINRYHATGVWSEQMVSTGFPDLPDLHWSSAGRGGYDFHNRHPMGRYMQPWPVRRGGLLHLQFVSGRRLRAKQAKYKCDELLRWPGREPDQVRAVNERYNLAVYGVTSPVPGWEETLESSLALVPAEWWDGYSHLMQHLNPHETPWQESVVKQLIECHPKELAGLDLFGLDEPSMGRRD